ncbi:hypothetical protein EWM64_g5191 [Hericium alpestre]|uniref:YebC-like protein n=1 Tax=Hericium alpestre TaxID=135208 RepID=A0A4Y9ZY17_9AGAM|nr:hypothetical protein EWM64_g5191 [Hericium alpestre]
MFSRALLRATARPFARPRAFSMSTPLASGHNKWSKIKQRKGATDAQKSQLYGRAARDIMVAVKSALPFFSVVLSWGVDAESAVGLRACPRRTLRLRSPRRRADRAGHQLVTYEVMAHGTVGMMIECLTDNGNRTIHRLREVFNRHNSRFATVGFMFERVGSVRVSIPHDETFDESQEKVVDTALGLADDFETEPPEDGAVEIEFRCKPQSLNALAEALRDPALPGEVQSVEIIWAPVEDSKVEAEDGGEMDEWVGSLLEDLQDVDDVWRVHTTVVSAAS